MNSSGATSQPGPSLVPAAGSVITTVHLVILAVLAVAAIAILVIGARKRRVRKQAMHEVEAHAEQAGVPPPGDAPAEVAPAPAPSAPPQPPEQGPLADEPIAAASPMEASPASEAALVDAAPAPATGPAPVDAPLTQLKGLGPKVSAKLAELDVTTVGQIAALDEDAAAALDAQLGPFRGRMARDRWIEQARFLAAGDRAGFEAVFGKL